MNQQLSVKGQLVTCSLTKNMEQDEEMKQLTLVSEKHMRHIAYLKKKNKKLRLALKIQTLLLKGAGGGDDDGDDEDKEGHASKEAAEQ